MPFVIPFIPYLMASVGMISTTMAAVLSLAASITMSLYQQRKMERKARDAWNASVQDRNITIRSPVSPRTIAYGEVATGGSLIYAQSSGNYQTLMTLVIALAGHQINGVVKTYLDNEDIMPLTAEGYARSGSRYNPSGGTTQDLVWEVQPVNGVITLPSIPLNVSALYTSNETMGDNAGYSIPFSWTPGTNTVTYDGDFYGNGRKYVWVTVQTTADQNARVSMTYYYGTTDQTAYQWLVDNSNGAWTANHRGRGVAYAVLHMSYDEDIFPMGIPPIKFVIRGAWCYDPRDGQMKYTTNPALHALDYLISPLGFGCLITEVDLPTVIAAANACDELVTVASGTQKRYEGNTLLSTDADRYDNLSILLSAMAGSYTYSQGKFRIYAGVYRAPVGTLNDTDLADGEIEIVARASRADLFNEVRGTYVDPTREWQPTDFPAVKNATYVTEDGGTVLPRDLTLAATTDGVMAQRIGKILLEQGRQALTFKATYNLKAYPYQPGDNLYVNMERYGFSSKVFQVMDRDFNPSRGIILLLREESANTYNWNYGEATTIDPAPNTNLPNPYVIPTLVGSVTITSGTTELLRLSDGTIITRMKVVWPAQTDPRITQNGQIRIQYRQGGDAFWKAIPPVPGDETQAYISNVEDGKTYYVRLSIVNTLGVASSWYMYSHVVQGKLAPPSDVTDFSGVVSPYGIKLSWSPVSDPDLSHYEIRRGASWDTGTIIDLPLATIATDEIKTAAAYTYWIAAVDTIGNYSATKASTVVTIQAPPAPTASGVFSGANVVLAFSGTVSHFAIEQFAIRYGASWGADPSTEVRTKSSTITFPVNWGGSRTYWVAAVDIAGNVGTATQVEMTVPAPNQVTNFRADVVDNNVLLYWSTPSSTLPIKEYEIRKGATWAGGTVVGSNGNSNFTTVFETVAGTYTYWIVARDTANNDSTPVSISVVVASPPDFKLAVNRDSDYSGTKTNLSIDGTKLIGPINNTETWAEHFTSGPSGAKNTMQDFINAGYTYASQPTPTTASYVETYDYGATLNQSTITLTRNAANIFGTVSVTPNIKVSSDNIDWSRDLGNVWTAFATNFRYVRFTLTFATADSGMQETYQINERLGVKLKTLSGRVVALSADQGAGGTPAYITDDGLSTGNAYFIDVDAIVLTPEGTTALFAVLNFTDSPNPTMFRVLVFDHNGNIQNNVGVRWEARGV